MKFRTATAAIIVSALALVGLSAFAMHEPDHGNDALLKSLSKANVTLAQAIQQAARGTAAPISAKFEMDHAGRLALSVYVADKGLKTDAEDNVFKELIGSPESAAWSPQTEVFKDVEHVARSAEHFTIMRLSSKTLLDIVRLAEKSGGGTVFSITPEIDNRQAHFDVHLSQGGKVTELGFDLDGKPLAGHDDHDDDDDHDGDHDDDD